MAQNTQSHGTFRTFLEKRWRTIFIYVKVSLKSKMQLPTQRQASPHVRCSRKIANYRVKGLSDKTLNKTRLL